MQTTDTVLMIRPIQFDLNEETLSSNAFQQQERTETREEINELAVREFDEFVALLEDFCIRVIVVQDTASPNTPDSVFPNNWVSFHTNGQVVLYPMQAEVRRLERRIDILDVLEEQHDWKAGELIDFVEGREEVGRFLEGTGSMVLDRVNRKAYACISPRTDLKSLEEWCGRLGYQPVAFKAVDQNEKEIYHTNVLMSVGTTFAVVCLDSIIDVQERKVVIDELMDDGKEIVDITFEQMNAFAGNMLLLHDEDKETVLVVSEQAWEVLEEEQQERLSGFVDHIVRVEIPTIERYGGGSVRCMLAEVF